MDAGPAEETRLLEQIANGDRASFDALYRQMHGLLFTVAMGVLNNREAAQDVVQEMKIVNKRKPIALDTSGWKKTGQFVFELTQASLTNWSSGGEKFMLGFTKKNKMTINKDSKYTLIFNTKALESGYQVGISKRNAGVDGNVTLVETAKRDKKLAVLYVERAPETKWRGAGFDAKSRIGDAYYMNGQKVGNFIENNIK